MMLPIHNRGKTDMRFGRIVVLACLLALVLIRPASAGDNKLNPKDWPAVLDGARGQTVYWNAWGGEQRVNDYIAWVGEQVKARYGVNVVQVKLSDTGEAVSKVVAEKAAGRSSQGSVDLIWITGANFASMKQNGLLFGPWAEDLPNFRYVDVEGKPCVLSDFTVPTDGLEAPWSMAQIVFYYDTARLGAPPKTANAILGYA